MSMRQIYLVKFLVKLWCWFFRRTAGFRSAVLVFFSSSYCGLDVFVAIYIAVAVNVVAGVVQIANGEIFATINQKDGMVSFHENPKKYNSVETMLELSDEVTLEWTFLRAETCIDNCTIFVME